MKKSIQVNIKGRIFNIDHDAYQTLEKYLDTLRQAFTTEESAEIVDDIETGISEHFASRTNPSNIITLQDVTQVIETMGAPEQIITEPSAIPPTGEQPSANLNGLQPPPFYQQPPAYVPETMPLEHKLYRRLDNKILGGVLAGLATYTQTNVLIWRLVLLLLCFITGFGPFTVIYLLAWALIPPANTPQRILELEGQPITPHNIGRTVVSEIENQTAKNNSAQGFLTFLVKLGVTFAGLVSTAVFIGMAICTISLICILVALIFTTPQMLFDNETILVNGTNIINNPGILYTMLTAALMVTLAGTLISGLIIWGSCYVVFGIKAPGKKMLIWSGIILLILLVVITILTIIGKVMVTSQTLSLAVSSLALWSLQ